MILEVAVAVATENASHRKNEGDIIVARKPKAMIGTWERRRYLWFMLDATMATSVALLLSQPYLSNDGKLIKGKRRFTLSLDSLRVNAQSIGKVVDLAKVRDKGQFYQPFFDVADNGDAAPNSSPLSASLLIDKGGA